MTINFFLNEKRIKMNGEIPIYARVILNREKFELSTKLTLKNPNDWDEITQRLKTKSPLNKSLAAIEHDLDESYNFLKYNNKVLSITNLKNQFLGGEYENPKLKVFLIEHYEKNIKGNSLYEVSTQKSFNSAICHLKNFMTSTNKNHKYLSEVDLKFINDFEYFLCNGNESYPMHLMRNSINKYHIKFKTILNKAIEQKLLAENPYRGFKIKNVPGRLTFLTSDELTSLKKHSLGNNKCLQRVRDIFLFSVYTGLRFTDAISLKENNIQRDWKNYWITFIQKKTDEQSRISMLNKAVEIFKKYESERKMTGYVLPRITNQKLNVYLKVIAELVKIEKPLTHHVARHTAATTIFLENDISMEVTGKQLGHRSIRSTQIYAKVTNKMLQKSATHLNKIL